MDQDDHPPVSSDDLWEIVAILETGNHPEAGRLRRVANLYREFSRLAVSAVLAHQKTAQMATETSQEAVATLQETVFAALHAEERNAILAQQSETLKSLVSGPPAEN